MIAIRRCKIEYGLIHTWTGWWRSRGRDVRRCTVCGITQSRRG